MKYIVIIGISFLFLSCSSAQRQTPPPKSSAPVPTQADTVPKAQPDADLVKKESCESGNDSRTLEVHKKPQGCELSYTKFGASKVVASGKYGTKHCEDSLNKITKKLEAQNFKCEGV